MPHEDTSDADIQLQTRAADAHSTRLPRNAKQPLCPTGATCGELDRRRFIQLAGAGIASVSSLGGRTEMGVADDRSFGIRRLVSADKGLSPA